MNLSIRSLWILAVLSFPLFAQHKGDAPPKLVWDALKGNCPASLEWAALRGKVVAVSFGTSFNSPYEIAQWNDLSGKFQDDSVVFLPVVTGSEFLLDQALTKISNPGCTLWDLNQDNSDNFKLDRASVTVFVNREGSIAGYSGNPSEKLVRDVLDYLPNPSLSESVPARGTWSPPAIEKSVPSYEVRITPARRDEFKTLLTTSDSHTVRNFPLKVIIADLWNSTSTRISWPDDFDETSYDVTLQLPVEDPALVVRLAREAIEKRFGLTVQKEVHPWPVYLLTVGPTPSPQFQPATEDDEEMTGGEQGGISGTANSMETLALMFEYQVGAPVFDQTGLKGKYNYTAVSKLPKAESGNDLAQQLGLELTRAERPVEMLMVRKAQ